MTHFDQKSTSSDEEFWNRSGLLILGVRLVQGWIFFSAGTRRLIYAPAKLDADSAAYVGNKLVHAMPGALFGIERIIDTMLQMPVLTDLALWIWTLAELLVGASLMLGLMSRLSGALSILFSVNVMLAFGWMGSTCLDEWTMAVSNFAMGTAIVLAGGGTASIDYLLMKRRPRLAERPGFVLTASGSLSWKTSGRWPLWLGILSFLFAVGFYHLLFGGVIGSLHHRVSFHHHHISLSDVLLDPDGSLAFRAYVDAGPDTKAAYIMSIQVVDEAGNVVEKWKSQLLSQLPQDRIRNDYPYAWAAKLKTTPYGLSGATGARAAILLPGRPGSSIVAGEEYRVVLKSIDGSQWSVNTSIPRRME